MRQQFEDLQDLLCKSHFEFWIDYKWYISGKNTAFLGGLFGTDPTY